MNIASLVADRTVRQLIKFGIVGLLTTAINLLIYGILVLSGINYLLAAVIAFAFATLNSYSLNRRWTFRAGAHRNDRLVKFSVVQLAGLIVNLTVLATLVEHLGFHDHKLFAQLIANAFVVVTNFSGNKFWTFK